MVHLQEKSGSAQLQVTMLLLINHLDIGVHGVHGSMGVNCFAQITTYM